MQQRGDRILGPYRCRGGWRNASVRGGKKRFGVVHKTKQEAEQSRRENEALLAKDHRQTLREVMDQYETYKREERGNKPRSVDTEMDRLRRFFGADALDLPLPRYSVDQAQRVYQAARKRPTQYGRPPSDAEHQNCLKAARRFGSWLVKRRLWASNPLKEVELVGQAKRGEESKPQLSSDQGQQWLDGALAAFELGDQSALAAAVLIAMGPRVSEIASRLVSHLDLQGTALRITKSKTAKGKRGVPVPSFLQDSLREQAQRARAWGRAQDVPMLDPPLFPPLPYRASGTPVKGEHLSRHAVGRAVHRICRAVGLPLVCPHALRGTFASLAVEDGEVVERVAKVLGHGPNMTRRHYATEDSQIAGAQRQRLRLIEGGER